MSLSNRMNQTAAPAANKYKEGTRNYKLQKRIDFWSEVKGIGEGIKQLDESTQRNLAQNLDNQAGHMSKLTETQIASSFNGFTPENMLRLVRLAMPNVVRSKIFTEFAMETVRDSIKFVRPVYSKTQNGKSMIDRTDDYSRLYDDADEFNDINNENYRRAIYETTDDRINQELANIAGAVTASTADADGSVVFTFAAKSEADVSSAKNDVTSAKAAIDAADTEAAKEAAERTYKEKLEIYNRAVASQKWANGKYIDGYCAVYYINETMPIAVQDKRTKKFYVSPDFSDMIGSVTLNTTSNPEITVVVKKGAADVEISKDVKFNINNVKAYARFDSEEDFNGDYLGEIEIKMSDYEFRPRPTSIGVTWSQLSELTLDTSFSVSVEEYLVTYAASAIKQELDYRAIREAYKQAKINPKGYHVVFDAAYNTIGTGTTTNGTKEGYRDNASTFTSAISTVGDNMYNDLKRGGVSRLVCGPSAGTYMGIMPQFTTKGAMPAEGAYQLGELEGKPVFKVPAQVIPTNEVLCVFKNPSNEADISIAFGTLVPFFSTGVIQRKNLYKEAALATYGDWAVLNRRYLATITIKNLKDVTTETY